MKTTIKRISYQELANRLDNIFLFNKAPELDENMLVDGLENGEIEYCFVHDDCDGTKDNCEYEMVDIYQYYLISSSDADYLKAHTNEIVFYSDVLDEYVWGITHWGTAWVGVHLDFKEEE